MACVWPIWPPPPSPPAVALPPTCRVSHEVGVIALLLLVLLMLLGLLFHLRHRGMLQHREPHAYATLSPEAASTVGNFELAELRHREPDLALKVELILNDTEWLRCFWAARDQNAEATFALVKAYAPWSQQFELDDPQVAEILSAGLIDILPGSRNDRAVVAVVRDIQVLGHLLQKYSFRDVIAAHLMQLKRLLKTSARARQHGVSMVHDLARLNWALVRSMMDPRNLHPQVQVARLLFTAYPVRFEAIVVVDAPPAFGTILKVVKAVAPDVLPETMQFVSRPEAESHCERVFGQRVL